MCPLEANLYEKANSKTLFGQTVSLNFLYLGDYVWHGPIEAENSDNCTDTSKSKQPVQNKFRGKLGVLVFVRRRSMEPFNFTISSLCATFFIPLILVSLAFKRQYLAFYINMPLKYKNVVSRQTPYTETPMVTLSKVIGHRNALVCS